MSDALADPVEPQRKGPLGLVAVGFLLPVAVAFECLLGLGLGLCVIAWMGWSGNFFSTGAGIVLVVIFFPATMFLRAGLRYGRSRRVKLAVTGLLILIAAASMHWTVSREPEYQGSGRAAADTPMARFLPADAQDVRFTNRPGVYKECEFPYGEAAFVAWMARGEFPFSEQLVMAESPGGWRGTRDGSGGGYTSIAWDRETGRVTIKVQSH